MKNYLIILMILTLSGCRTVKKEWVKENYQSKVEAVALAEETLNRAESLAINEIQKLTFNLEEKLQETKQTTTEEESQTTSVYGSVEAEDGKAKSVTFGGTKITTEGFNVKFESTSIKLLQKQYESQFKELSRQLDEERKANIYLDKEITALKNQFANFTSSHKTEKYTKTKEVKKSGFSFWAILVGFSILLLYIIYRRYKGYLK